MKANKPCIMKTEEMREYLKENWLIKSNEELAKHIGKGISQLRVITRAMGLPAKTHSRRVCCYR